jgi:hypothetical protein
MPSGIQNKSEHIVEKRQLWLMGTQPAPPYARDDTDCMEENACTTTTIKISMVRREFYSHCRIIDFYPL